MIRHTESDWDLHFLQISELCSRMSKDPSTKVGAVIRHPDKSVVSTGYNGFPPGVPDTEEDLHDRDSKYMKMVHAEENAILFARKRNISTKGCTIYSTMIPCIKCYTMIKEAGIVRIVSKEPIEDQTKRWGTSWRLVRAQAEMDEIAIDIVY